MQLLKKYLDSCALWVFCSIICKCIYDYLILNALPERYIYSITYGVDFDKSLIPIAYFVFFVISILTFYYTKDGADIVNTGLRVVFFLYYLPLNSSLYLNSETILFLVLTNVFWLMLLLAFSHTNNPLVEEKERQDAYVHNKLLYLLCILICLGCIVYGYKYNGLKLTLDITNIYDARADFAGSTSMLESVLFHFGGTIIVPLAIIYSLKMKRYLMLIISIVGELAIFSIARQKSNLFVIILALLFFYIDKKNSCNLLNSIISVLFLIILVLTFVQFRFFSDDFLFKIFIRRMMYIPSWLNTLYYEFFSQNKLLLWTQDVFLVNNLGIARYDQDILTLINSEYFNGYISSPNTGLFAEAYMHFGIFGAIFYPLFIVLMTRVFVKSLLKYDKPFQLFLITRFFMSLTNVPLSGGIFCVTYFSLIPFTAFVFYNYKKRSHPYEQNSSKYNM